LFLFFYLTYKNFISGGTSFNSQFNSYFIEEYNLSGRISLSFSFLEHKIIFDWDCFKDSSTWSVTHFLLRFSCKSLSFLIFLFKIFSFYQKNLKFEIELPGSFNWGTGLEKSCCGTFVIVVVVVLFSDVFGTIGV